MTQCMRFYVINKASLKVIVGTGFEPAHGGLKTHWLKPLVEPTIKCHQLDQLALAVPRYSRGISHLLGKRTRIILTTSRSEPIPTILLYQVDWQRGMRELNPRSPEWQSGESTILPIPHNFITYSLIITQVTKKVKCFLLVELGRVELPSKQPITINTSLQA